MNAQLPSLIEQELGRDQNRCQARVPFESELSYGRYDVPPPFDARAAAVLILLFPGSDTWRLPLTLRREDLVHGGQISLPGGLIEPNETSRQAALRELEEELGVRPGDVSVIGRLSDLYLFVSNYVMTPWVATIGEVPQWVPQEAEVAEVIEVPLPHLTNPASVRHSLRTVHGVTFRSPHIEFGPYQIWGATSMILGELISLIRETGPTSA